MVSPPLGLVLAGIYFFANASWLARRRISHPHRGSYVHGAESPVTQLEAQTRSGARMSAAGALIKMAQVWGTYGGYRKAHPCRTLTSFSTTGHRCGMKRLSRARILRALRCAPYPCALPQNKSLLPISSAAVFAYSLSLLSSRRLLPCSAAQSRRRSTPLSPPFNLHRARVRRNHGRLRSNGLIERAQSTMPCPRPRQNARPIKH